MRLRGTVLDRLRHRVGLAPDDVTAQVPAVSTQCEGEHPWDADQVLGLEPFHARHTRRRALLEPFAHVEHTIARIAVEECILPAPVRWCVRTVPAATVVRVPDVHPDRA